MEQRSKSMEKLSGGVFMIGLALAFVLSSQSGGHLFLPVLFFTLGATSLLATLASGNSQKMYSGFHGMVWMIIMALFFLTGLWIWFLVGAGISAILGALGSMITAGLASAGILASEQRQPVYQPPTQPYVPTNDPPQPYQSPEQPYPQYQEGYNYQEEKGEHQHHTPKQLRQQPHEHPAYEQPSVDYPLELPPQQ